MAAGVRSPLGVWVGGAGAYQRRAIRSLLAFWIGGASNPTTQAGFFFPFYFKAASTGAAAQWHLLKNDKLYTARFRRRERLAGV
jgi:hypothetical protein